MPSSHPTTTTTTTPTTLKTIQHHSHLHKIPRSRPQNPPRHLPLLPHHHNDHNPEIHPPPSELIFGRTFTDHMLSIEWTASAGWLAPRITPYQNLSLDPATCVFHYAFEAFEGMKAYKNPAGEISLFRPDKNMARLNRSATRIALPAFDGAALIELIKEFVRLDERFIPAYAPFSFFDLPQPPSFIFIDRVLITCGQHPAKKATPSTSAPP